MKKIVIVGAGYAGVLTAKKLAKRTKKSKDAQIILIDKNPFHTMLTEIHEVAANRVDEKSIRMDLDKIFAGRNVDVVLDTVTNVDYDAKKVYAQNAQYDYDYLVMSAGSKQTFFGIKGAQENSFSLWSYEDAIKIKRHVLTMFRQACKETDPRRKGQMLTFYVVGAGFTGIEMVGELAEWIPSLCSKFHIDRNEVTINCVDMLDKPCQMLPDGLSGKITKRLYKMGVNLILRSNIEEVGPDFIIYKKDDKDVTHKTDTVIWTAGIESADVAKNSTQLKLVSRGRIQTDPYLRAEGRTDVFVGGDNIFYIPDGKQDPVVQMVENCEYSASCITHNLLCHMRGKADEMKKYNPRSSGAMVSIGGRYCVAMIKLGGLQIGLPSFLSMFTKHFINLYYFIQVLGWEKCFAYLYHEIFTIRNKRSFVGGHFSNRSSTFFLVPLRIWLGIFWIIEGAQKVSEGWLKSPRLTGFFNGANSFYNNIINAAASGASKVTGAASAASKAAASAVPVAPDTASSASVAASAAPVVSAAADAASAASSAAPGAAASAGHVIFNFGIPHFIQLTFVQAGDYAFRVTSPISDFIINNFVLPHNSMQMTFQTVIVLLEIIVGVLLIIGAFTTPSAVVSLGLQLLFLSSTGLYMATWWMPSAIIAMLFGAGRVFSVDYYMMPALRSWWANRKFVKKWYIYNDDEQ